MKKIFSNLLVLTTLFNLILSSFYPVLAYAAIPSIDDGIGGCCTQNSSDLIKGCKEGETCSVANGACEDGWSCKTPEAPEYKGVASEADNIGGCCDKNASANSKAGCDSALSEACNQPNGACASGLSCGSTPVAPPPPPPPVNVVPKEKTVPQAITAVPDKKQEVKTVSLECNNPAYFTQHTQECISQYSSVSVPAKKTVQPQTSLKTTVPEPGKNYKGQPIATECSNPGYFTQHLQDCVPQLEPPKPTPTTKPTVSPVATSNPANKLFNFFNNKESQQAAVENYTATSTLVDTQDESELSSRRSLVGHATGIEYQVSKNSPDLIYASTMQPAKVNPFQGAKVSSGVGQNEQKNLQQQVKQTQKSQQQTTDDYRKAQEARMQACGPGSKNIDCTKAVAKTLGLSEDTDPDTVFKEFQQRALVTGFVVTGTNFYDANYSLRPPDQNSTGVKMGNALRSAPEAAVNFVTNNGAEIVNKIVEQQQKEIYARDVLRPAAGITKPLPYGSFLIFTSKNADERVAALKQELEDDLRLRPDAALSFDQLTNRRKYQQYLADLTGSTNTNVEAQKNFVTFGMKGVSDQSSELINTEKQLTELENKSGLPHTNTPNAVTGWTSRLDLSPEVRSYYAGLTDEDLVKLEADDLSSAIANGVSPQEQQKIKDKIAQMKTARDLIKTEDALSSGYTSVAIDAASGTVQAALTVAGIKGGGAVSDVFSAAKVLKAAPGAVKTINTVVAKKGVVNAIGDSLGNAWGGIKSVVTGGESKVVKQAEANLPEVAIINPAQATPVVSSLVEDSLDVAVPASSLGKIPRDFYPDAEKLIRQEFGRAGSPDEIRSFGILLWEAVEDGRNTNAIINGMKRARAFTDSLAARSGTFASTPEQQAIYDTLRYSSDYTGSQTLALLNDPSQMTTRVATTLIETDVKNMKYGLDGLVSTANRQVREINDYVVANGFSSRVTEVTSDQFHIVSKEQMRQLSGRDDAIGLSIPWDGQLLLREDISTKSYANQVGIATHEICHECANRVSMGMAGVLQKSFSADNTYKLIEATNDFGAKFVSSDGVLKTALRSDGLVLKTTTERSTAGYLTQVAAVHDELIPAIMRVKGLSRNQANAIVLVAARDGRYEELIEAAGGVESLSKILDSMSSVAHNLSKEAPQILKVGRVVTPTDISIAQAEVQVALEKSGKIGFVLSVPKSSFWALVNNVYAAEDSSQKGTAMDSQSYESLVRQQLVTDAMLQDGQVDADFIKQAVQIEILKPDFNTLSDGYLFTTGKAGVVDGNVAEGKYKVIVDSMPDIDIKVPGIISVTKGASIVIPVKVAQGTGKVEVSSLPENQSGLLNNLIKVVYADEVKDATISPQVKVMVVSEDDQLLPWARVQVKLEKIEKDKAFSLNAGWNLITLDALPSTTLTASELIADINNQGGEATTVSILENGAWKSYVARDGDKYSLADFPIEPGKAYFVKSLKFSIWEFTGQEFVAPIKLSLKEGWNAVGLPISTKSYKAASLIDSLNKQQAQASTLAVFTSGLWDTFVKHDREEYGNNFAILGNQGYILKVGKDLEFSP